MSTIRGLGRYAGAIGATSNLLPLPDIFAADTASLIVNDWFWPPGPPTPVQIPYAWLSPPLRSRPDKPMTTAAVSQSNGGDTGTSNTQFNEASLTEYGDNAFTATLNTACAGDIANLAKWILDFYATAPSAVPRARFPSLTINLAARAPHEIWRILDITLGTRVSITDTPAGWPAGASEQVVEGIHHAAGANERWVEFNTAPVVGSTAGAAGPWFRLDTSMLGGTDVMPY